MGGLLSSGHYAGGGNAGAHAAFMDYDVEPAQEDREIFEMTQATLARGSERLDMILRYQGADELIRAAMNTPSDETSDAAWDAVISSLNIINHFYEFSQELEQTVGQLIVALFKSKLALVNKRALARQLAEVFNFAIQFDFAKTSNNSVQNDYSFYKRMAAKPKYMKQLSSNDDDLMRKHKIYLFLTQPTPMINSIITTTLETVNKVSRENISFGLATMVNICNDAVLKHKLANDELTLFCLRTMVEAAVLHDHVSEHGSFAKKSLVNVKACLQAIRNSGLPQGHVDVLSNVLRFTSKNYTASPESTKRLFN